MINNLVFSAAIVLSACARAPVSKAPDPLDPHSSSALAAPGATDPITRVDPNLVCMVNNQYMGKPQIPVIVDGKTYFGCCEICKSRLSQDADARAASDPVSGVRVDKAASVIGKDASGAVLYFENETNLKRYAAR